MDKFLNFKASTNVKNLIGKDLVTDELTAVFELVKNSYDADAEEVRIEFKNILSGNGTLEIVDTGTGMDLHDIQNKWMVIGTESKKYKMFSDKFDRPLNGDKGIGRFSVDRLGKKLELISIKASYGKKIIMSFDWTEFENEFKNLDQVYIPYGEYETYEHQGVSLKISQLRDIWDEKSIQKLVKSLRQFKSPFNINDNFKIIINAPEFNLYNKEIVPYNLGDISSLWVTAEIPLENTSIIMLKVVKDGIQYNEEYKNIYEFGPVKSTIYFFNQPDKLRFNSRLGMTVRSFGNVRLYRDDFRIYPYGESFNDWLDLDIRKAEGYSRFFGSRDLIGYVQIYKKHNPNIDAPTNRQGIIENMYSEQLRNFIIEYPIKTLEKYFFSFKKAKNETYTETKKEIATAVSELKKVADDIKRTSPAAAKLIKQVSEVVQKGQTEQAKFVKDQEELIKVYKRVASKEVLLHRIIHEALINLDAAKSASLIVLKSFKELDSTHSDDDSISKKILSMDYAVNNAWSILLRARDNLIQKKEKENVKISAFLKQIHDSFKEKFLLNDIEFVPNCNEDIFYYIDKRDLQTIIENFISNSIKSLIKVCSRKRMIKISIVKTERYIIMNFKDNGDGIQEHLRNRIFDHFFSTTNGFGMGLSIVDEIVKEYSGELNLVDNNETGAEFQIKLRR